jgi:hypothetical protein
MWALYNARKSEHVISYVEKGMTEGYSKICPADWENGNKEIVLRWWRDVSGYSRQEAVESLRNILHKMLK